MASLTISKKQIRLNIDGDEYIVPIELADIECALTPYPPSDYQWEMAIMKIEDAISPFASLLTADNQTVLYGADLLNVLPHSTTTDGVVIAADMIELGFAVTAGLSYRYELPDLPQSVEFAVMALLLREWVHHMGVKEVILH